LPIPVMHDDQHGTAVVTLAGLYNALKLTDRSFEELTVVLNGAGAAGVAIVHLLQYVGVKDIIMCDSKGIVHRGRTDLNAEKTELLKTTNLEDKTGSLADAMKGSDCFIGVSVPDSVSKEMVRSMNPNPILFAMSNPIPEIMPEAAKEAGAMIMATGRSDYPNQINNVLAFPGIFRGLLDAKASSLTMDIYVAAAKAIAASVSDPNPERIIPSVFDEGVTENVAKAVFELAKLEQAH